MPARRRPSIGCPTRHGARTSADRDPCGRRLRPGERAVSGRHDPAARWSAPTKEWHGGRPLCSSRAESDSDGKEGSYGGMVDLHRKRRRDAGASMRKRTSRRSAVKAHIHRQDRRSTASSLHPAELRRVPSSISSATGERRRHYGLLDAFLVDNGTHRGNASGQTLDSFGVGCSSSASPSALRAISSRCRSARTNASIAR